MTYKKRDLLIQIIIAVALSAMFLFFYANANNHLREEDIAYGFAFLGQQCNFDLIMSLISFSAASTYLRAFVVAILNTLFLAALAIIFATIIGILIAAARLSRNWLLIKLGIAYVEFFRNIPILLQVFFWYFVLLNYMPQPSTSYTLGNFIMLNVRGLFLGNFVLIPELIAMFLALSLYAANYVSEHIRLGIAVIPRGQLEAAAACGMTQFMILRLIVLPQAARMFVPPIIGEYVTIIKNTSLGSAIGYPELVAVFAGTVLNQTGQAIETIFMTLMVYLVISLAASYFSNWYRGHTAIEND